MYIDSHSHLYDAHFDEDRDEVHARMREQNLQTIVVGTCKKTSEQCIAMVRDEKLNDIVYGATVGVHPRDTQEYFDAGEYAQMLGEGVVGVGECGFDYFCTPKEDVYERQHEVFRTQVAFAAEHDLPLMLHIRPSEGGDDAHRDALTVVDEYQAHHGSVVRGNVHFFTSDTAVAHEWLARGFTIAFPGVVTFAPELHKVVRAVPLDMMLVETDAPYAAPVPHRGKRNEPAFVLDTITAIAEIRGEAREVVAAQLAANAQRLFSPREHALPAQ